MNYTRSDKAMHSISSNINEQLYGSPLHKPCSKDLRVSYLEQYEINKIKQQYDADINRSRTKDALKDITDKYGFVWDEQGKLRKISQPLEYKRMSYNNLPSQTNTTYSASHKSPSPLKESPISLHNRQTVKKSYLQENTRKYNMSPRKKLQQNIQPLRQEIDYPKYSSIMEERQIDEKIKKIWHKYQSPLGVSSQIPKNKVNDENYPAFQASTKDYSYAYKKKNDLKTQYPETFSKRQQKIYAPKVQNSQVNYATRQKRQSVSPAKSNNIVKTPRLNSTCKFDKTRPQQYDTRIDEITFKIKKCEEQKEKLNIVSKKFDERSVSRSKSPLRKTQTPIKNRIMNYSPLLIEDSSRKRIRKQQKKHEHRQSIELKPIAEISKSFSFEASDRQKNSQQITKNINVIDTVDLKTVQIEEKMSLLDNRRQTTSDNESIKISQAQNLETEPDKDQNNEQNQEIGCKSNDDKKQREYFDKIQFSIEKFYLIDYFTRQIQLDQEFRNSRVWFYNNDDPHKWGILADQLKQQGINFNYHQLVDRFESLPQERNPFFSLRDCKQNYSSLIHSYKQADEHWKKKIMNNFSEQCLDSQNFTSKELDIENKGKLKIEDFVRYFNMKTKSFFRNRDFVLIFQRLSGRNKTQVQYSQIIRILTK